MHSVFLVRFRDIDRFHSKIRRLENKDDKYINANGTQVICIHISATNGTKAIILEISYGFIMEILILIIKYSDTHSNNGQCLKAFLIFKEDLNGW